MKKEKDQDRKRKSSQESDNFHGIIKNIFEKFLEFIKIFKRKFISIKLTFLYGIKDEKSFQDHFSELYRDLYEGLKNDFRVHEEPGHENLDIADLELIHAVEEKNYDQIISLIENGINVNTRDEYGMTALHHAGAMGLRVAIKALVSCGRCDYLIKDNKGRYASEMALEWSSNYAIARLLIKKQAKQAYLMDVPAWSKDD